ncbi:hypothetical protein ABZP36_008215 [Zizania latifolia]
MFAHVASISAHIAGRGCHVTGTPERAPLVLIGHTVSIIGGAIPIIAIDYGVLVGCWMRHMFEVVQAKSIVHDDDLRDWHLCLLTPDFLDSDQIYAFLVLHAPSSKAHAKQRNDVSLRKQPARCSRGRSFWRVVARNERCLTYTIVVATLQLFLHRTGANVTTLFLPMLSQATGCRRWAVALVGNAVLVLVNAGGILGSAVAARVYGREVVIPADIEKHAVMQGGGAGRMPAGYAAATFFLACVVSGGCGWSWGARFWDVPSEGVRSAGDAAGASLGFAQMHCFLRMLRQLKHAALAYYAVWIWS